MGNFFSSIGSAISSGYNDFKAGLSNIFGNGGQSAAAMQFPLSPGVDPLLGQVQSVAPNASTPFGQAYISPDNKATVVGTGANAGKINQTATGYAASPVNMSTNTNPPVMSYNPEVRPSTATNFQAPVDQYGRASSYDAGIPYIGANGQLVTPRVGFSGMTGSSSFSLTPNPITGNVGNPGVAGGGSAFTGTLAAAGGQNTPGGSLSSDEQARKKAAGTISATQPGTQGTQTSPVPLANLPAGMSVAPSTPNASLTASPISTNVDIAALSKLKDQTDQLMKNPYAMSQNDSQNLIDQINSQFLQIKAKYDQTQPTPEKPVVDTEDQNAFIQNNPDPFGAKQAMDAFREANTNLSQLQGQRIDVMKSIQSLNDAYRPIIDDIKTNPNLPKQLAARRLDDIQKRQKDVLQGFLDQQTILTQQISDQNETVNRAFNIVTFASNQADKAQDNARQNLTLFVNSGAVGGFTASDIKQYAQATGISTSTIQKMVDGAKDPNIKTELTGSADTGYSLVTYNTKTGTVAKTQQVIKGTGGSNNDNATFAAALNLYGNTINDVIGKGATPEQAVQTAVAIAKNGGTTLDLKTQNALLSQAQKLKAQKDAEAARPAPLQTSWPDLNSALSGFLFGSGAAPTGGQTTAARL